jgi:hypothetical protein
MIIHNFHVMSLSIRPDKTNSPLIVDANTVLARPISVQRFHSISRRRAKVIQSPGSEEVEQLASGHAFDRLEFSHRMVLKERFCITAMKGANQNPIL